MSNAQDIYGYLTSHGLSPSAASAVMGNLAQESSLNPDEPGGGLAQWIGSRQQNLKTYANTKNLPPNSMDAQLGFLMTELPSYVDVNQLNNMTPAEGALYVSNAYEKPNPIFANNQGRETYANEYYTQFTGNAPPTAPQGTNSNSGNSGFMQNLFGHMKLVDIVAVIIAIVIIAKAL